MDSDLYQAIGEHRADIISIKEELKAIRHKIEEDTSTFLKRQDTILEFIAEQKAGRKYILLFLGSVATFAAFFKDLLTAAVSLFKIHS